jgi:hypothetical protein
MRTDELCVSGDASQATGIVNRPDADRRNDELIEAILGTPTFEAWVLEPHDSLPYDADKINGVD